MTAITILLLIAIICWFIAATGIPTGPVSVGWLGLFFYGLSLLIR
jgi:hypothetical protein